MEGERERERESERGERKKFKNNYWKKIMCVFA